MSVIKKEKLFEMMEKEKSKKKHTVMIVDDEKTQLDSLERLLAKEYEVITAGSGQDALDIIDKHKYQGEISVIISDQKMPGLAGIALFERLIDVLPNTLRIILTAYDDKEIILDSINKAKIHAFILKPFEPTDLIQKIKNTIEQKKVNRKEELEPELKDHLSRLSREPDNAVLLGKIKDIYLEMGEKEKAEEVNLRLSLLLEKKDEQFNLGKPIKLQQIEIHDLNFFGDMQWEFQPGVNVLLGKNGYGKSQLLRLLAALLRKDEVISAEFFQSSKAEPLTHLVVARNGSQESIIHDILVFKESIGRVPILAIPDLRSVDRSKDVVVPPGAGKENDLCRQWCYHFLQQKPVEGLIQDFLYQLCITYLDQGKTFNSPIFQLIQKVFDKLSDRQFKFHKIEPTGQAWFKIEVITEGNPNPMPLQKASQGTLSVLSIFGLVYSYLKTISRGAKEEEIANQPAIVFIDEIDAHLHPSWQQKIINLLRVHFPNVQFIVTAHSPLVVAGCKEGEVAVLRKAETGFIVERFEHDFIGCEAAELYTKIFEIEENDDSYLYYNAVYPFRGDIEKEIRKLEEEKAGAGSAFSKEKEKKLNRLYDDLYYSAKANDKRKKRQENSMVMIENWKLKANIKKLEAQCPTVEK